MTELENGKIGKIGKIGKVGKIGNYCLIPESGENKFWLIILDLGFSKYIIIFDNRYKLEDFKLAFAKRQFSKLTSFKLVLPKFIEHKLKIVNSVFLPL